ncbi:MAG: AmmeMemoRadiSam system protein B [Acidobacteria bacterium]|nr:AmmeMemoRadiSam system protein B [Acidobacteriota bacterium]
MSASTAHVSPYAGQWYPGEANQLQRLIDACLEESARRTGDVLLENPAGLVVPHAGVVYSGTVAAAAYRHFLARPPERVFLLGFSHHGGASGLWIPEVEAIRTPLGTTEIDRQAVRALTAGGEFHGTSEERLCDHSVEIQLPFLQRCAPLARLVPIYVSQPGSEARRAAARRLAAEMRPGDVAIASSDFTHYGRSFGFQPFPVDSATPGRLRSLDLDAVEAAASLDEEIFRAALEDSGATVCGAEPIALLLAMLDALQDGDEIFQQRLDYQTSGEISGDFHHSVSYAALGYFRHSSMELAAEDQALLMASARATLERYQKIRSFDPVRPARITPALARCAGVFVSLHKDGALRGCVGRVTSEEPLAAAVPAMTLAAATEDSRFESVGAEETGIEIEISVLSPMKRVASKERIQAGVHGVMVDTGWRHGLLLPQVASERGWNREQFLNALAGKIGARPEAFDAPQTKFHRFRAQVFH